MCSDVFIIYELSSARVDVHRSKTSLPLNSLKINSPRLLLFARMFTARVTKKNSTNEFIRNPHFCSVFFYQNVCFHQQVTYQGIQIIR